MTAGGESVTDAFAGLPDGQWGEPPTPDVSRPERYSLVTEDIARRIGQPMLGSVTAEA